jgi:hypothetical protein
MLKSDRELSIELSDEVRVNLIPTQTGAQLELRKEGSPEGWADHTRKYLRVGPDEGKARAAHFKANCFFISLVLNPWRKALVQCSNCKQYFVKERIRDARGAKYCSRKCRGPAETMNMYRERHRKRLLLAKQIVSEKKVGLSPDWKSKLAKRLDVTSKWVTLAVNRKELENPCINSENKGGKHSAQTRSRHIRGHRR